MDEKKLDSLITDTLVERAERLSVSPEVKQLVRQKISEEKKEKTNMKHRISGKIVILAAALCLLGTMGAVAAGRAAGLVSHSNGNDPVYGSYGELRSNVKQDLGYSVKTVESLGEGWDFRRASIGIVQAQDETGNVIGTYLNLKVCYGASKKEEVSLIVRRPGSLVSEDVRQPDAAGEHGGIELRYYCDRYKFLPAGTEISEEDRLAEERGELFLSYGSDQTEINDYYTVSWKDEGISYSIQSSDQSFTADEMFAMAAAVIDGK